jgi:VWFA-related protein
MPCLSIRFWPWALALMAAIQTTTADTSPRQRFTSSIEVVQVDVSAIDGNGLPIRDLTLDDFTLTVDGRPRPIVSAQFVGVPAAAAVDKAPPPQHYSSNADAAGGRLIMIVVDRTSIAPGRGRAAIEAASRFISSLNRADRVALATIPQGPQVTFTADHELVQTLLRKVDGNAVPAFGTRNIGVADALAFERKDQFVMDTVVERECGIAAGGRGAGASDMLICKNEVRAEANLVAADVRNRARTSIDSLRVLIDSLPARQTPTMLVLISEGLVIEREAGQLSWLEEKAAAAHVTVYSLHLETGEFDASQRRPLARASADRAIQEQGLAAIAQATRGDMFRVVSNSDFAFQRLSNELSGYYLLGFEPESGDRDARPHTIGVKVKRSGVTVRSRRQFTAGVAAVRTPETEILRTLRDPLPATDIPIKLTTFALRDRQQDKMRLLIAAEVDRTANPGGDMSVGYVLVDFNGKLVASQAASTLPRSGRDGGGVGRYLSTVLVDPGRFSLKLVVVDDGRRRGSVERVAVAELTNAGPVRATDLLIADAAGRASDMPLVPSVSGRITGTGLDGYLELLGTTANALGQASVTLEIAENETAPALERVPVPLVPVKENPLSRVAAVRVNIERFAPGNYVARAVIAVGLESVGQVIRPFTIAPRHAR